MAAAGDAESRTEMKTLIPKTGGEADPNAAESKMKPRVLTDVICLVVFFVALGGFVFVLGYAFENGNPEKLTKAYSHGSEVGKLAATVAYENEGSRYITMVFKVLENWNLLVTAAFIAGVLGFCYLYALHKFATQIVYTCLIILIALPLVTGAYLLYASQDERVVISGDSQFDLYAGACGVGLGVLFAIMACCSRASINTAIACVKVASSCIFSMPSLLMVPGIYFASLCVLLPLMLSGLLYLLTSGGIESVKPASMSTLVSGHDISGQLLENAASRVGVSYSDEQKAMIAFYVFMMLWVMEICTAIMQFVIAYAVILWYFTPITDGKKSAVPNMAILSGYAIVFRYHFGTVAFGAFLVATLRAVRMVLGYIAKQGHDTGNPVLACVAKILICVVECFKRLIEFLNKNAYMDVALNSTSFCVAAKNALGVIANAAAAIGVLNGTLWVLMLAGVGAIGGLGGYATFALAEALECAYPEALGVGGTLISAIVAVAFMQVFDMVADTLLFCYVSDKDIEMEEVANHPHAKRAIACCPGIARQVHETKAGNKALSTMGVDASAPIVRPVYTPPELKKLVDDHS